MHDLVLVDGIEPIVSPLLCYNSSSVDLFVPPSVTFYLTHFHALQRITWTSRERDTELCLVKGKSDDDCNNYIRVLAKTEEGQLLVCGTNSYNPRCRYYKENDKGLYDVEREFSGKGYCPYDPRHNSTSIFAGTKYYIANLC